MAASRIAEHVGRVLSDRYRLTRPLGTGASAHVYVAEDVTLRRRVAVKLLHPALADDEAFLRRFQAEAQVVAALRHPNIVRVYDWGNDGGTPFLVMELLEGGSLRSLLDRGHLLSPSQAVQIGADAARALDYAHKRGLVHRDMKPANMLFDENGQVSVADFGLARALAEATWTEPVGAMLGTARYAAPEQISGGALDGRADVYALALVIVEAVSGKVPFAADTTIGTLMARVDRPMPLPEELGPLAPVIGRAGTPNPADRLDAADLAAALAGVARQLPAPLPLTLAGTADEVTVEEDPDLTELPGQPRLFDADKAQAPVTSPSAAGAPLLPRQPLPPLPPVPTVAGLSPRRSRRAERSHRRRWVVPVVIVLALIAAGGGWVLTHRPQPTHPVPNLGHVTVPAAERILAPLHLRIDASRKAYDDVLPAGSIISQQPATGTLREGSVVTLVISQGLPLVTVPDLAALSEVDAKNRLIGAGLAEGNVSSRFDAAVKKGLVLTWSGQGGQLTKGSPVDLVLSNGPPVVPVPAVAGQAFAAAQAALAAQGLTAVEDDQFSTTVAKGQVVGSSPPAGTSVPVGSKVTVTVSKGPDVRPVPDVKGQSVVAATQALHAAGFVVAGVNGSPDKAVTGTSPAAGTQLLKGASVTLNTR